MPHAHLAPLTPLVGRVTETAAILALLNQPAVRLVTLIGPGGVGKTRLAQQLLATLSSKPTQDLYFVSLAPITDLNLVFATIAQACGLQTTGDLPLLQQLVNFLSNPSLLILDNFEQLVPAAPQLGQLLAACPNLKILVTSRAALHLSGEYEFPVPPLSGPEAVTLFNQRASAIKPDLDLSPQNSELVSTICQRLDGLPLAIELAAARVKLLPLRAMLARLENRLSLLTDGPRDAPTRQQSLRQALDWSYNLLELGEQRLFRRLGVFVGGCSLEAAEAVCNLPGELPLDVLRLAQSLISQSLLRQEEDIDSEPRLWMLETMREYALEQLTANGETVSIHQAHAHFYLQLAQTAEPHLVGSQQVIWLNRLEQEHNNLRAALRWTIEAGDHSALELGLLLGASLGRFWTYRGHLTEGRDRLTQLLAASNQTPAISPNTRALALNAAGLLAIRCSVYSEAKQLFESSLPLWRELGHSGWRGEALALDSLGWVSSAFGQFEHAHELYEASLALHRQFGHPPDTEAADTLAHLGMVAFITNDLKQARLVLEESLSAKRALGEKWGLGFALFHLACVAISEARYDNARTYTIEGLAVCAELHDRLLTAYLLESLAWLALVAPNKKDPALAARLFGAAETLRQTISAPRPPQWRALTEQIEAEVKAKLGADRFATEIAAGNLLTPTQAQAAFEQSAPGPSSSALILSPRELEVLQLVAAGHTDAQVAQKLVVSVRTVNAHLQSIYNKLGVSSRMAAVRAATDQKLV